MRVVDLRSDTVTRPTPAMRRAMAEAEVGDDVWGDDPTVIELEAEVARMLGKEAAVYVPSGTMGNQIVACARTPGPATRSSATSWRHIVVTSRRRRPCSAGVQTRMLLGDGGVLDVGRRSRRALRDPADVHHARQSLLCLENTHRRGRRPRLPPERLAELADFAHATACACTWTAPASGTRRSPAARTPAEMRARRSTRSSVCFSKGLGAPVGSAVVGSARVHRRRPAATASCFGGGMRQAGIIAAGALHALRHHVERLADDHANARRLAEGLPADRRLRFDPEAIETNIVIAKATGSARRARARRGAGRRRAFCAPRWTTGRCVS